MKNKKAVIIIGAGGAIPWDGPTTNKLTKLLCEDSTFKVASEQTLGAWLKHVLTGHYHYDKESVNFEMMIHAVENLSTYYNSKKGQSIAAYKNLIPAFFREKEDLFDEIQFTGLYQQSHGFWKTESYTPRKTYLWTTKAQFFDCVYRHFINLVVREVETYQKVCNTKEQLNSGLTEFLDSFEEFSIYNLNYDRVIPTIYSKMVFEGFNQNREFAPEIIFKGGTGKNHYNLHGSAYFDFHFEELKPSDNACYLEPLDWTNYQAAQDGQKLIDSPIITGFNKSSRIISPPHSDFYFSLNNEILSADILYVIGYSFSDIHVNRAIQRVLRMNDKLRVNCVDLLTYGENDHHDPWIELKDESTRNFLYCVEFSRIGRKLYQYCNQGRTSVFRFGFKEFLEKREWENSNQ